MKPDHDIEQVDYGIGYKAQNSPQQHTTINIEGGKLAIAIALMTLGGMVVSSLLLPQLLHSYIDQSVAVQLAPVKAQVLSAQDRAWLGERNSTINQQQLEEIRLALVKHKILVDVDDHH